MPTPVCLQHVLKRHIVSKGSANAQNLDLFDRPYPERCRKKLFQMKYRYSV